MVIFNPSKCCRLLWLWPRAQGINVLRNRPSQSTAVGGREGGGVVWRVISQHQLSYTLTVCRVESKCRDLFVSLKMHRIIIIKKKDKTQFHLKKSPLSGFKVIRDKTPTKTSHKNVMIMWRVCMCVIQEIISLLNCINAVSCWGTLCSMQPVVGWNN